MALVWLLLLLLLLLLLCAAPAAVFAQMSVSVQPGGSIQAALDKVHAAGGGTVHLEEVQLASLHALTQLRCKHQRVHD